MKSKFENIYLFHGRGGSPLGSVAKLQNILERRHRDVKFIRPLLLHSDVDVITEDSLAWSERNLVPFIKPRSLIVGISLGGLLAAKIQETKYKIGAEIHDDVDLSVFSIAAPTNLDTVQLEQKLANRVSIYSSTVDDVIKGRCEDWPEFTDLAFDVPWLSHDIDASRYTLCFLISCYICGLDVRYEVDNLFKETADVPGEPYY